MRRRAPENLQGQSLVPMLADPTRARARLGAEPGDARRPQEQADFRVHAAHAALALHRMGSGRGRAANCTITKTIRGN